MRNMNILQFTALCASYAIRKTALCYIVPDKAFLKCSYYGHFGRRLDLKNPKTNRRNAGFTDEERAKMTELLESGFIDTFRYFNPEVTDRYSWWSYMFKAREKNAGWRIDYFLASEDLQDKLISAEIHDKIMGSDHCPVELVIDL